MDWIIHQWARFIWWCDHLSTREAAILGAFAMAAFGGLAKYVALPLFRWLLPKIGAWLYPIVSGAVVLDRWLGLRRYLRSLGRSMERLRNPWLEEGARLREIFVPVAIHSDALAEQRADLGEAFRRYRAAVLIGEPGSGKTTGLRALALDCIQGRLRPTGRGQFVPVYIELRSWAISDLDLDAWLVKTFQTHDFPKPQRLIRKLRASGSLVFLLDGLDEVDDSGRQHMLSQVRELLEAEDRARRCRVYVTSRPVGYQGQFSDVIQETLRMAEFTPVQIRQFIRNWKFRPPKSQARLLQSIMSQPQILAICRNPLMLTIVASLYKDTDYKLPDSRDEFYKQCIDALLRRWDEARELEQRNKFPAGLKQAFISQLSYDLLAVQARELDEARVMESVGSFLAERRLAQSADPDRFLQEILRSGLLSRLPNGLIHFAHRTLAEALAASYLRNRPQELCGLWERSPDTWLEVCSLYVADPQIVQADISVLLESAHQRQDWLGLITLAGEAHTCPLPFRTLVPATLMEQRDLWGRLDHRATTALARMGDATQELLTLMVKTGSAETRRRALHALGWSGEPWAVQLLLEQLTDPTTQAAAADALASLGDEALPILEDLVHQYPLNPQLCTCCAKIAAEIGTERSLAFTLPLMWHVEPSVGLVAAHSSARLLRDPALRRAFESDELGLPALPRRHEVANLLDWAVPWLEQSPEAVRIYACKLIKNIQAGIENAPRAAHRELRATLELLPPVFAVPVLAGYKAPAEAPRQRPRSFLQALRPSQKGMIPQIATALRERSQEANRRLWARARGEVKKDIALSEGATYGLIFIVGVFLLVPIVTALIRGVAPLWWLGVWAAGAGGGFLVVEKDRWLLAMLGPIVAGGTGLVLVREKGLRNIGVDGVWGLCYGVSLIAASTYSALRLGGGLWFGPATLALLSNVSRFSQEKDVGIVFWRRSNPLLSLVRRLEAEAPEGS